MKRFICVVASVLLFSCSSVFLFRSDHRHFPIQREGRLIESMDDISDWMLGGSGIHYYYQKWLDIREGQGAIELISTHGDTARMYKSLVDDSISFRHVRNISLWVKLNIPTARWYTGTKYHRRTMYEGDRNTTLKNISIYLTSLSQGNDPPWSRYFRADLYDSTLVSGWNHLLIDRSLFAAHGAISWDEKMKQICLETITDSLKDSIGVVFDDIRINQESKAVIIFTFDDGDRSQYNLVFPLFRSYQPPMKGVLFVNCELTKNTLSDSQKDEIYKAGWDISNHCWEHSDLPNFPPESERNEIYACYNKLMKKGWTRSAPFFAYPFQDFDSTTVKLVKEHCLLARSGIWGYQSQNHFTYPGGDELYKIKSGYLNASYHSNQNIMAMVNATVRRGGLLVLEFHSFTAGKEVKQTFNIDSLKVIADYIDSLRQHGMVEVMTFSHYLSRMDTTGVLSKINSKMMRDIASYMKRCNGCYQRLFPTDHSTEKDNVWIIDPSLGADSLRAVIQFYPHNIPSVYEKSIIFPNRRE